MSFEPKLSEHHTKLLERGVIDLRGEIDGDMMTYVRDCIALLTERGNPSIEVWITSAGGDVDCAMPIYDYLRLYPGEMTGKAVGFTKSMATIVLQACKVRHAEANAMIQIHNISLRLSLDVLRDDKKFQKWLARGEAWQINIDRILSKRTKRTLRAVRTECRKDRDMTAQEALRFGLIDKII